MVLLHEFAHELEHFRPERQDPPRDQRELEAESASTVVTSMLGIAHPTARDYLLMYHADVEALKASLGAIHRLIGQMVHLLGLAHPPKESAAETPALAAD